MCSYASYRGRTVLRNLLLLVALGSSVLLACPASADEGGMSLFISRLWGPVLWGPVETEVLTTLSDQVRAGAQSALEGSPHEVMTRENLSLISSRSGEELTDLDMSDLGEIELARKIGAAWVVSGQIAQVGESLTLTLKLHSTADRGRFLASRILPAKGPEELLKLLPKTAEELVRDGLGLAAANPEPGSFVRSLPLRTPDRGEVELTAAEQGGWQVMQVRLHCSNDESPAAAEQRAARAGRLAFLHQSLGGDPSTPRVLHSEASATLVQRGRDTPAVALLVSDGRVETRQREAEHGGGYWLHRRSVVRLFDGLPAREGGLNVAITLGRERLVHGDEQTFVVRSSTALKLLVLSLSEAGTSWLLPGPGGVAAEIAAGGELAFPTPAMKKRGLTLQVGLPDGQRQADEAVLVVGIEPGRSDAITAISGKVGLRDLFGALYRLPADSWGFAAAGYRIEAR